MKIATPKKMALAGLGKFSKKFSAADRLIKRLIHLYAIVVGGRYTQGSLCIFTDHENAILLVETIYKQGKGFVGGLPKSRTEQPRDTMLRETAEEIGVHLRSLPTLIGLYRQKDCKHLDAVFAYQLSPDEIQQIQKSDGEIATISWHLHKEVPAHLDEDGQEILAMFNTWQKSSK